MSSLEQQPFSLGKYKSYREWRLISFGVQLCYYRFRFPFNDIKCTHILILHIYTIFLIFLLQLNNKPTEFKNGIRQFFNRNFFDAQPNGIGIILFYLNK